MMKIFRVLKRGYCISYAILDNNVIRLDEDPIKALIRYSENKEVLGDKVVGLNYEELLTKFQIGDLRITKPLDPPEVWGSGISYEMARERYSEENVAKIMGKTIYERVYDAVRPEIFFKATSNRCVGHGEAIVIRSDSEWTLPEPELAVVLDSSGRILGYTIMDDVSARDIEADNPLYLPQSKIYYGSCAFGPFIVTPDEIGNPYNLDITLRIIREGKVFYEGSVNTSKMRRKIEEQIEYLIKDNPIPDGTILTTGTAIVPGRDKGLKHGDVVEISISKIGTLITPVIKSERKLK
ncbi:MAG: fumarylacetoacetate hydrolase family protein [Saccharolobus sp.]|jgi:2-dehydro-3-deoxy-D-arabinonate dehydratase|uniref:fumarylacetoacetate hydrolase family protein n=1 Tax=Saccharolobus sp. TaxID=2100761 RepID=UPI0028CE9600|nr:fumarylacetoacetate hydrolase family protein [Saccharolobus sp.]MDT7862649.1 fumarylacetoacetate hydrolase family protein [Saccharolobus sp.]